MHPSKTVLYGQASRAAPSKWLQARTRRSHTRKKSAPLGSTKERTTPYASSRSHLAPIQIRTPMNSSNSRLVLVLLLGGLLGGGLARFFAAPNGGSASSERALSPGASESSAVMKPVGGDLPAAGDVHPSSSSHPVNKTSTASEALPRESGEQRVAAAVPTPRKQNPAPRGSISGFVREEQGTPISGAVVQINGGLFDWVAVKASSIGQPAEPLPSLAQEIEKVKERYLRTTANTVRTTTDGNGHFQFDDVADMKWRIEAFSEGYTIKPSSYGQYALIGTNFDLVALPVIEIPVEVLDESGELVAEALIYCKRDLPPTHVATFQWDQQESSLRIAPGEYEITAYAPGTLSIQEAKRMSESQTVVVVAGTPAPGLRFQLHRALGISGRVELAPGESQSELAYVTLMPLAAGQEPNLRLLADSEKRAFARPGSRYHFLDLEAGRYVLGLKRSYSAEVSSHAIIELETESITHDFELGTVDFSKYVKVTVTGSDGNGINSGLYFALFFTKSGTRAFSAVETVKRGNGQYLLGFNELASEEYSRGTNSETTFQLHIQHKDLGTQEVDLPPGQTELDVLFEQPGLLVVTVDAFSQSEFDGRLRVVASRKDAPEESSTEFGSEWVDASGTQALSPLIPGTYELTLRVLPRNAPAHGWYSAPTIDTAQVRVESGENQARLRVPDKHPLQVHWKDAKPGAMASLRSTAANSKGIRSARAYFSDDGLAHFEFLEPGEYRLSVSSSGTGKAKPVQVSIPSDSIELESL